MQVESLNAFTTQIWKSKFPNFEFIKNQIIGELEFERLRNPRGLIRSNTTGYRSTDLTHLEKLAPVFKHVMEHVVKKVIFDCNLNISTAQISESWCLFNDKLNSFNFPHTHPGLFSGIFYVSAPPGSGELIFPNYSHNDLWIGNQFANDSNSNRLNKSTFGITPEEGMILIWCSHLPHYVVPNHEDVQRISISFNIVGS